MIEIKLIYGEIMPCSGQYGVRVTAIDKETNSTCDSVFNTIGFQRISIKRAETFIMVLEQNINQCMKGVLGLIPTIEYPKIGKPE
jgi:hypothetical protein